MSEKIIISTDSTSDIPVELQEKYGINSATPLIIIKNGEKIIDNKDIQIS